MRQPITTPMQKPIWIFGYGSLIWRPDFVFQEKRHGLIKGWQRVFYQGSTDHRGTRTQPGRVATIIRAEEAHCWGTAFRVDPERAAPILAALDHREKDGYARIQTTFYEMDGHPTDVKVLVYVASQENQSYLGPAPIRQMAQQIAEARGESGPNTEYLFRLADSLRAMGVWDGHVFDLESQVRRLTAPKLRLAGFPSLAEARRTLDSGLRVSNGF